MNNEFKFSRIPFDKQDKTEKKNVNSRCQEALVGIPYRIFSHGSTYLIVRHVMNLRLTQRFNLSGRAIPFC